MQRALAVLAIAILLFIGMAILIPSASFAAGWLSAFVFLSMIPIGSLALLLVFGITGGRWGKDFQPVLEPAARATPLLLLLFVPVLLLRPELYDWRSQGVPADVLRDYLNPTFFAIRTVLALLIWSAIAWGRLWKNELSAGLALVAHGVMVSLIPADWVLTLRPFSASAGFGLGFGIEQLFAALACVALLAPQGDNARANRDLAGMMVTALLGTVYFDFMQFIVIWYGNIPEKVHWFTARTYGIWPWVALASFLLGAAIPFLGVLNAFVRARAVPLQGLGALVLMGIGLHVAWMTMPAFGYAPIFPGILSVFVITLLSVAALPMVENGRLRHGS